MDTTKLDATKLEEFLKNKQWREADEQTCQLMLEVSGREKEGWIDLDSIKKFPWEDLQTIDQLWVHHSDGLYGFSVQKQIYVECGGKLDFSLPLGETWEKFCNRTASMRKGHLPSFLKVTRGLEYLNVKGHLPSTDINKYEGRKLNTGALMDLANEGLALFNSGKVPMETFTDYIAKSASEISKEHIEISKEHIDEISKEHIDYAEESAPRYAPDRGCEDVESFRCTKRSVINDAEVFSFLASRLRDINHC
jgi:hypothetical protein